MSSREEGAYNGSPEEARGPSATSVLRAEGLTKDYRIGAASIPVLRGVSIEVREGETVSIMGASGAGKTTLLYILGGLDAPTSGKVTCCGQDLFTLSGGRRDLMRALRLGFVFQAYYLLPELDVLENVMLPTMIPGRVAGRVRAKREKAMDLLSKVGLDHRAGHRPAELSGGEQQRAALARALINDPDIVLADEPTGNLDSRTGEQVLGYLLELTREKGHSLVLVTHNESVARLSSRVHLLRDGVLA